MGQLVNQTSFQSNGTVVDFFPRFGITLPSDLKLYTYMQAGDSAYLAAIYRIRSVEE
jgi:hypothetical protein